MCVATITYLSHIAHRAYYARYYDDVAEGNPDRSRSPFEVSVPLIVHI